MENINNFYGVTAVAPTAGSDLSHAIMPVVSRKRSREEDNHLNMNQFHPYNCINNNNRSSPSSFTFLGQDFSSSTQRDLQLDRFITHHMEWVRMELEKRGKIHAGRLMSEAEQSMMKKLKTKDEEIQKIGEINWAFGERVKTLSFENQVWRNLAQANEAIVTDLRKNLVQVLHMMHGAGGAAAGGGGVAEVIDDAQSCCGSNFEEEEINRSILVDNVAQSSGSNGIKLIRTDTTLDLSQKIEKGINGSNGDDGRGGDNNNNTRMFCRNCGKEEACVLLLPCRHLCLCGGCGSTVHVCPVCNCEKSCSLLVNLSA